MNDDDERRFFLLNGIPANKEGYEKFEYWIHREPYISPETQRLLDERNQETQKKMREPNHEI